MGTTYNLTVVGPAAATRGRGVQRGVDSLLAAINAEVNTYDATSMISRLNAGDTVRVHVPARTDALQAAAGAHLAANVELARGPVRDSRGAFDPTVGPLVEYYGFGASGADTATVDAAEVARLVELVGFAEQVALERLGGTTVLYLRSPGARLDLSAIAKGYAVDQVHHYLTRDSALSPGGHFVEIGGEVRTRGLSPRGSAWTVGVNTPAEGSALTDIELAVAVSDRAVATSGNYRNVRERGGRRYVHTIDPATGSAEASPLLSATVIAPTCARADAYATACMAAGDDAPAVLAEAGLPGCLIFAAAGAGAGDYDVRYVGDFERYLVGGDKR